MKVLVVDDETPILEAVAYNLKKEGYDPLTAADADHCLELFKRHEPDLIILDVMLPSASGLEVCRKIRAGSDVPIIMLTARVEESDRVIGLELGADDYVTKPFSMRELMARVKSVLRRAALSQAGGRDRILDAGDVSIDSMRHEVTVDGRLVALTPKEFDLLRFLAANPERVFTRETLLARVWGADAYIGEKTVDVHIRWLREKIEEDPGVPRRIMTMRGIGYKFVPANR